MKKYEGHVRGIRGGLTLTGEQEGVSLAVVAEPAACNDNTHAPMQENDALDLAELLPVVRQRLGISNDLTDDVIFESLKAIASESSDRARWRIAFESPMGVWLSQQGRELGNALTSLVAMLPAPRS